MPKAKDVVKSGELDLLDLVDGQRSLFWFPAFLENIVTLPAAVCQADGCSIFLRAKDRVGKERLFLAATTRRELRSQLFSKKIAYYVDQELMRTAAQEYQWASESIREGSENLSLTEEEFRSRIDEAFANCDHSSFASLTGWVAAFRRVLKIDDLTSFDGSSFEDPDRGVPAPVWSNRTRGFFDWEPPRPFLAVPCCHEDEVIGVVRVTTIRDKARPFDERDVKRLKDFAERLGRFVAAQPRADKLYHYFRIWADAEGDEMARRITEAVPELFGVDCCSFFQRDDEDRFVLRSTVASESLKNGPDAEQFSQFRWNCNRLYYEKADEKKPSKTGYCIARQEPVMLERAKEGWALVHSGGRELDDGQPGGGPTFVENVQPKFLEPEEVGSPVVGAEGSGVKPAPEEVAGEGDENLPRKHVKPIGGVCEMDKSRSEFILLVPVRDVINPRKLAGVLRVVSAKKTKDKGLPTQLSQFAFGLAARLGEVGRRRRESVACEKLTRALAQLDFGEKGLQQVARSIAEALEADAVTVFSKSGDQLRSRPALTYLNEGQMRDKLPPEVVKGHRKRHEEFKASLANLSYDLVGGETSRTALPAKTLSPVRMKNLLDAKELRELDVTDSKKPCEIDDPGPFIAAPVMLTSRDGKVDGVVRALRWKRSPQGPFSTSHELILKTCTPILAHLLVESRQRSVVIAYSYGRTDVLQPLKRMLHVLGLQPLFIDVPEGEPIDRHEEFEKMADQAAAAIVVATPDQRGKNKRSGKSAPPSYEPSSNVQGELKILQERLKDRVLVLKQEGTNLPYISRSHGGRDLQTVDFSMLTGVQEAFLEIAETFMEWELLQKPGTGEE